MGYFIGIINCNLHSQKTNKNAADFEVKRLCASTHGAGKTRAADLLATLGLVETLDFERVCLVRRLDSRFDAFWVEMPGHCGIGDGFDARLGLLRSNPGPTSHPLW